MAEKRMFSMKIIDSDAFLDMPLSTQALYFHLSMRADDDGFLNNAKRIMDMIKANQNDYDLLKAKRFIIEFPDGICVIKHWRINNYIRKDRYHETTYTDEKDMLAVKKNGAYSLKSSDSEIGIPECNRCVTESRVDKSRVEENRTEPVAMFNAEKAWDDTFNIYPKKSEAVMAKQAWLDKLAQVLDENRKEVALLIAGATRIYLADYREKHRDDENYQYIPKYAKWLVNDCDYWIREYEKRSEGDGS